MIISNRKNIVEIHADLKDIIAVYAGSRLVWNKITELSSCYANGYWIDEYPWTDNTPWTD